MPKPSVEKQGRVEERHLFLAVEMPSFYTEDIDLAAARRDHFQDSETTDSEILLNHMGEPGLVKLTTEISGEKDSEVIEVLGMVRSASLERPTPGLNDDDLQEQAYKLQPEQDEVIERAVRRLWREDVPPAEIIELLEGEIEETRRRAARRESANV